MDFENVKEQVKLQFQEVSDALFAGQIQFNYIEETGRVSAEASSMFGLNMLRYSETNFKYFFLLHKYLCLTIDILNLRKIDEKLPKLMFTDNLLSVEFIYQISLPKNAEVPDEALFLEYNFISNIFVFLHECGHLNQNTAEEPSVEANHFSEFNSDYYAITKILQYYYTLKTKFQPIYEKKVRTFGNEHDLIRAVIVNALLIIFLEALSKTNTASSKTHPDIKSRFCNIIIQVIQQLNKNFGHLFVHDKLSAFIGDIFRTLDFIEREVFEQHDLVFDKLLDHCASNFD
jgi:hypothetical protein